MSGPPGPDPDGVAVGLLHFRALAEAVTCVSWLIDKEGRAVECAGAWRQRGGGAELADIDWLDAFAEEDRQKVRRQMSAAWRREGEGRRLRARLWSQAHSAFREVELTIAPVFGLDGSGHVLAAAIDVSPAREAEEGLRQKLAQREALVREHKVRLRELNHRVKNDLQLVSGFLESARRSASTDSGPAFEAASQRVRAIAQVYDRLTSLGDADQVELKDLVAALVSDAAKSLGLSPTLDGDKMEVSSTRAITVALVLNELLINVAKHAYPEGGPRPVQIAARRRGPLLELTVRDLGSGLPAGFDPLRLASAGAQIILSFVNRSGGRIVFSACDPGTEAVVILPLT